MISGPAPNVESVADSEHGVPSGWDTVTLGAIIIRSQYGLSLRGARSGAVPILRMNCQQDGRVLFRDLQFVNLDPRTLEQYRLRKGDLLFNRTNSYELVGRTALFDSDREAVFASYLIRLGVDDERVDPRFLNFYLNSHAVQVRLKALATRGVSQSNISAGKLKDLPVLLPPLAEQQRIGEVMDRLDAARRLESDRLASLRALKAATMAKLFREGLRDEPLRETEAGAIPDSWSCRPLGDLLEIAQYGLSLRGGPSGRVPILRMNCQDESRVRLDDLQYVDLDRETLARFRLERGDLLFNRTNSFELVGRTAIFDSDVEAVFASYLIRLRTNSKAIAPRFLNYYLNLSSTQQALKAFATRGVSQSNISASKLRLLQIPVPPLDEQQQIADHLDFVMRETALTKERLDRLEALFATVLSALMTGVLRVPSAPAELETVDAS